MNNNLKEWFGSGLKIKKWLLLILVGTIVIAYGLSNIMVKTELEISDIIRICIAFALGCGLTVAGVIMAERRMLQAIAESNVSANQRNLNIKRILYDKKTLDKNIKIVVIGGGTGLPAILKGLKVYSNNITAIVTANNGINQTKEKIVAPADLTQSLISLSNNEVIMKNLLNYKLENEEKFSDILLTTMNEISENNFAEAIKNTSEILAITGKVIPATLDKVKLGAILKDGTRIRNEQEISKTVNDRKSQIEKIFLQPERCTPAPGVIKSIKEANLIIIGPGNLYTKVIPTLLIKEITDEIKKSNALKILVSNIMSEPNQTDEFKVSDFINAIHDHVGKGMIDYCIANDSDIMPEYIRKYNIEGAELLEIDKNNIKSMGIKLEISDFAYIDEQGLIRHDPNKLSKVIMKIVCDNMNLATDKKALETYIIRAKMNNIEKKNRKKNILTRDVKIINTIKNKNKNHVEVPIVGQKK